MGVTRALLVAGLVMVLGATALDLKSPCPDLFRYDSTDQPGYWTGTLTLLSDDELHGVWLRLIFDEKLTELTVEDDFGEIVTSGNPQYLIKNRNFLLKASTPTNIKIRVKYEGEKVPNLTGFRLNANMMCPKNVFSGEVFSGDLNSNDFLASILSGKTADYKEFEGCGTTPLLQNHEVNKKTVQSGRWPWQAAVYIQSESQEKYICEASLISAKHLLIPAHCVTYQNTEYPVPVEKLTVHLGKHGLDDSSNNVQKFGVESIHLYPGYRSGNLLNDLSIIYLDKPVIISDYVRPICLGNYDAKKEGFLVGYGINQERKIGDLTQVKVKIINGNECATKRSDLRALLTDNVFCASYVEDNSLCVGDSGGSFVSLREGPKAVWELRGVVIVGVALQNMCSNSNTMFLVDIANYSKWIQAVIS